VQILFFAAMTAALVSSGIMPHRVAQSELSGGATALGTSARALWWVHLAWATIGFVRIYIVLDRRPREARLIQDLIVAGVYLGVTLAIIGFVFGVPVGTLVATSGVVAIILGLALTRPDESHLVTLAIRIAADRQPSAIEAILKTALDDCRCIVQDPKPGVALKGMDRRRAAIPCHQPAIEHRRATKSSMSSVNTALRRDRSRHARTILSRPAKGQRRQDEHDRNYNSIPRALTPSRRFWPISPDRPPSAASCRVPRTSPCEAPTATLRQPPT
jgi:hypothetical protein